MIGIVNVQWFDNPGAVLLCYALQQTVGRLRPGEQVEIINYTCGGKIEKAGIFHKVAKVPAKVRTKVLGRKRIAGVKYGLLLRQRHERYEEFRKEYLNRTAGFRDVSSPILDTPYTHCIVGSDVVWKPDIAKVIDAKVYFLQFADKSVKKIAYAASIGTDDDAILQPLTSLYKKLTEDFDAISMREASGVAFMQPLTKKQIKEVADPVFLLDKEDYRRMIPVTGPMEGRYIYLYLLSPNGEAVDYAIGLAKKKALKILFDVHTDVNFKLWEEMQDIFEASVAAGPAEFLSNIYYADYVVTDSFHGTSFSLIFQKEFYTYPRISNGVDISTRMKNLLEKVDLRNRYCIPEKGEAAEKINYCMVDGKIAEMRKDALEFLKGVLE